MLKKSIVVLAAFFIFSISCNNDCTLNSRCELAPDTGPCFAALKAYYYDQESKKCKEFTWGGCNGVVPFHTLEECKACECNSDK